MASLSNADKSSITSSSYWTFRSNPLFSVVQTDTLSDIDNELVTAYRHKHSQFTILIAERRDLLHISNRYSRSSTSEYIRALLPEALVKRLQEIIDAHPIANGPEQEIELAHKISLDDVDMGGFKIISLLNLEKELEFFRAHANILQKQIALNQNFLTTLVNRLQSTLITHFYASGNITEAMVAGSIVSYKLVPWQSKSYKHLKELSNQLTSRIVQHLNSKTPVLALLDLQCFNIFIPGSCAANLIKNCGAFDCASEARISETSTVEYVEKVLRDSQGQIDVLITLLARVWIMDQFAHVCTVEWDATRLEICKIGIVRRLLSHYLGQDNKTDAYDLFSFYRAMKRDPRASLKKYTSIVNDMVKLYREDKYNSLATELEKELLSLN